MAYLSRQRYFQVKLPEETRSIELIAGLSSVWPVNPRSLMISALDFISAELFSWIFASSAPEVFESLLLTCSVCLPVPLII